MSEEQLRSDTPEYTQKYIAQLYARILQLENQIKAYDNYVVVLCDELDSVVQLAHIHGWRSHNIERGKDARQQLACSGIAKYQDKNAGD